MCQGCWGVSLDPALRRTRDFVIVVDLTGFPDEPGIGDIIYRDGVGENRPGQSFSPCGTVCSHLVDIDDPISIHIGRVWVVRVNRNLTADVTQGSIRGVSSFKQGFPIRINRCCHLICQISRGGIKEWPPHHLQVHTVPDAIFVDLGDCPSILRAVLDAPISGT